MTHSDLIRGIGNLLFMGLTLILFVFINFLFRRSNAELMGIPVAANLVHTVLGPLLVIINSILLVFLCALLKTELDPSQLADVQNHQVKWVLGPLLNPFFVSKYSLLNNIGYAFLIILWWLGMHSFIYFIQLNPDGSPYSKWIFGWQSLINVLYLAVGLASMIAIQTGWQQYGLEIYQAKRYWGFLGILIGAFLPPLLLKLGIPKLL
jgi:hypothetical protein